jgi:hypothetical protein
MRYLWSLTLVLALVPGVLAVGSKSPAYAAFHCMRIHAVMHGFMGDDQAQYVELRMNMAGQGVVFNHTIEFYDASGTLKATFTFPANVANANAGESILIGTSRFNELTNGGDADFVFSAANTVGANGGDPLHPVQGPDGLVHFAQGHANCLNVSEPGAVDSVAYGTATGHYGNAADTLPTPSDNRALRLDNLGITPSDNESEYDLESVSMTTYSVAPANLPSDLNTPRNNSRTVLQLQEPGVGGVAAVPGTDVLAVVTEDRSTSVGVYVTIAVAIAGIAVVAAGGGRYLRRR